ncbi:MAG: ABC transporter permease [Desulfobacterales bacterium]|nr:ABC transporter permease [Desulfobacterales bacterium]
MLILEPMRDALRALRVNILRSALTTLGIMIGVGAVIVMVAVGAGAQAQVAEIINSMGADLIYIFPGTSTTRGLRLGAGTVSTLTEEDGLAIKKEIPEVQVVAPYIRGRGQIILGNANWNTSILGVTPEFFEARDWAVADGRGIVPEDLRGNNKVLILGNTVAQNLGSGSQPTGSLVRLNRVPFTVIGLLSPKGYSMGGWDQDDTVLIPMPIARTRVLGERALSGQLVSGIAVKVKSAELVAHVENEIRELLRQRHRLRPGEENDFWIRNQAEALESRAQSSRTMSLLLAAVASVSLVVGGIGIMNIMLVSVTERTREIGLRMAVGARRRDILSQFLTEAALLSMIGGMVGILLGVLGSLAFTAFGEWPAMIKFEAILIAFSVSAAVGLFFGFYPARTASRLDPIEALRRE